MNSVKVLSVIQTISNRGTGTADDPIRNVTQYWDFDGNLLAENDPGKATRRWGHDEPGSGR